MDQIKLFSPNEHISFYRYTLLCVVTEVRIKKVSVKVKQREIPIVTDFVQSGCVSKLIQ
jgi:hypothetical protein